MTSKVNRRVEVDGDQFRSIDMDCSQCNGTGTVQEYDAETRGGIMTGCECIEYPTTVVCQHCGRELTLDRRKGHDRWVAIHYDSGLPDCYYSPWWQARVASPVVGPL